jgi:hypothetical protein
MRERERESEREMRERELLENQVLWCKCICTWLEQYKRFQSCFYSQTEGRQPLHFILYCDVKNIQFVNISKKQHWLYRNLSWPALLEQRLCSRRHWYIYNIHLRSDNPRWFIFFSSSYIYLPIAASQSHNFNYIGK